MVHLFQEFIENQVNNFRRSESRGRDPTTFGCPCKGALIMDLPQRSEKKSTEDALER